MEYPLSSAKGEVAQLTTTIDDYLQHFEDYGIVSRRDLTKPSLENMDVMNRGRPYEILSVDDDPINQMVIASVLETAEFVVHQAMDGFEALDFMSSATTLPDLILLDVMMPGLSGYEVCAKLRAEYPPDLPIIMISAKNSSDDVIKGLKYKCNDYVTKPFEKSELLARINTQVKLRQMVNHQARHRMAVEVLQRILPPASAKRIIDGVYDDFENYREVTIVTCVLEGLDLNDPPGATASLNKYFNELDNGLKERKALLKMESCDDSYSFICGLSPENAADHTVESLDFARTMIGVAAATDTGLRVRVGVHTIKGMLGGLIRTLCPRVCSTDRCIREQMTILNLHLACMRRPSNSHAVLPVRYRLYRMPVGSKLSADALLQVWKYKTISENYAAST